MISPVTAQLHRAKGRGSKAGAGAGTSPASWDGEVVISSNQAVLRPLRLSDLKIKDVWGLVNTESQGVPSSSPDLSPGGHWMWPQVSTRTPDPPPAPGLASLAPQLAAAVPVLGARGGGEQGFLINFWELELFSTSRILFMCMRRRLIMRNILIEVSQLLNTVDMYQLHHSPNLYQCVSNNQLASH